MLLISLILLYKLSKLIYIKKNYTQNKKEKINLFIKLWM